MITVTRDELDNYREALKEHPRALRALDMIEDCEGDLEDAAIALALHAGQEPNESGRWLEGFAKRWRVHLCTGGMRDKLLSGAIADSVDLFSAETMLALELATCVVIYLLKTNIDDFCKPLEEKL